MKKFTFTIGLILNLFAANAQTSCQRIISTIAGTDTASFSGDGGAATAASFMYPTGVVYDAAGNLFICDQINDVIRMVNTSGTISTVVGTAGFGSYSGDGGPASAALLYYPSDVKIDDSGNLYIPDYQSAVVRKVNTLGIISTVAGNDTTGYSGDGGPATAASFNTVTSVAIDDTGNLYIVDAGNMRIRKVAKSTGIVTTIAGTGAIGYSGDSGAATAAELNHPDYIVISDSGDFYISDLWNNVIRKINTAGIITTIAGTGIQGSTGDGGTAAAAELYGPGSMGFDALGNLYISQFVGGIRMINTSGIISTITADDSDGFSGDGGPATAGQVFRPSGICFDASGNLIFADSYNQRVRKITPNGFPVFYTLSGSGTFPDATTVELNGSQVGVSYQLYNDTTLAGSPILGTGASFTFPVTVSGNYFVVATNWTTGCSDTMNGSAAIVILPSSVANQISGKDIIILPNPVGQTLSIKAPNINRVQLYDIIGRTIIDKVYNCAEVSINVSSLKTGVYFVRINSQFIQKIVKE